MKRILLILLILLFYINATSAPLITGVAGTVEDEGSIVISSSNSSFGTKSPEAPERYDLFQQEGGDYDVGDDIANGWDFLDTSSAHPALYNQTDARFSGGKHVRTYYGTDVWGSRFWWDKEAELDHYYITFWMKTTHTGTATTNKKYVRLTHNEPTNDNPITWPAEYAGGNYRFLVRQCDGSYFNAWTYLLWPFTEDVWERYEYYIVGNTPGTADGILQTSVQHGGVGNTFTNHHDEANMEYYNSGCTDKMENVTFGTYRAAVDGGTYYGYFDDIYIDNTRSRVEIGDTDTWAACTHREIQIPSAWASDEITVTVNTGAFSEGAAFLYVVDSDGDYNADGWPITIGDADPDTEPPYTAGWSPEKSATGVSPSTDMVIEVYEAINAVDRETILWVIEGANHCWDAKVGACDNKDIVITGTGTHYTITYNPDSNFAWDEEVTWTFDVSDTDTPANDMDQDSGSFTITSEPSSDSKSVSVGANTIITLGGNVELRIN